MTNVFLAQYKAVAGPDAVAAESVNLALPKPKPAAKGTDTEPAGPQSPSILEVEETCEECGGSGCDPGGIDPWDSEPCPACHGAKTRRVIRNYLAEAFQIAGNLGGARPVERQHLVAVIQHCREVVSALISLPEVA